MSTYEQTQEVLKKNGITSDQMDNIIAKVSKINWKLKKIIKDCNCHWSELQPLLLQSAIDIYNRIDHVVDYGTVRHEGEKA